MPREKYDENKMEVLETKSIPVDNGELLVELYSYDGNAPGIRIRKRTDRGKEYKVRNIPMAQAELIGGCLIDLARGV